MLEFKYFLIYTKYMIIDQETKMNRKYILKEITPAHLMCAPFPGCPAIYI